MSQLGKIYFYIRSSNEKGLSVLIMLGVLAIVALLGFGGNYLYFQLKNTEKSEKLTHELRNSFAILSDIINKQSFLQNITMDVVIDSGAFKAPLFQANHKTVEDCFGNRITISYRKPQGGSSQDYIAFQTLVSSSDRTQVCGAYLKLLENQEMKDYLRFVDTVSIVDRGNPENNITFCAKESTEECRSDVWAALSDLNGENQNDICKFYCKEHPCLFTILLTQR